mgnify:FL=1
MEITKCNFAKVLIMPMFIINNSGCKNIYFNMLEKYGLIYNKSTVNNVNIDNIMLNINNLKLLSSFAENPNAIHIIEYNLDYIQKINNDTIWKSLSKNPNASHILKNNFNHIFWNELSANSGAISLLNENQNKINWIELLKNKNAIKLIEDNWINKYSILSNNYSINIPQEHCRNISSNPNAIHILIKHPSIINWFELSKNPNAIDLLTKNSNKINLSGLVLNPNAHDLIKLKINDINKYNYWKPLSQNYGAIELLKQNYNKINWDALSRNYNAIDLIEQSSELCTLKINSNINNIDIYELLKNPNIFIN